MMPGMRAETPSGTVSVPASFTPSADANVTSRLVKCGAGVGTGLGAGAAAGSCVAASRDVRRTSRSASGTWTSSTTNETGSNQKISSRPATDTVMLRSPSGTPVGRAWSFAAVTFATTGFPPCSAASVNDVAPAALRIAGVMASVPTRLSPTIISGADGSALMSTDWPGTEAVSTPGFIANAMCCAPRGVVKSAEYEASARPGVEYCAFAVAVMGACCNCSLTATAAGSDVTSTSL